MKNEKKELINFNQKLGRVNEKNIPLLKQSTIKQHEVKQESVNFSQLKREKLAAMDARKVVESDFTGITEQDRGDLLSACKTAKQVCEDLVRDRGQLLTVQIRQSLIDRATRFNELYEQLNK